MARAREESIPLLSYRTLRRMEWTLMAIYEGMEAKAAALAAPAMKAEKATKKAMKAKAAAPAAPAMKAKKATKKAMKAKAAAPAGPAMKAMKK
jgi:hypothetical protein